MTFQLQLLHASDLEGGVDAIERAPNFTAIANAFQDALPDNTITLSAGDNYLSGPFFSAAGDQSSEAGIEAALAQAYEFLFELEPGTLLPLDADAPPEIETDNGRVDVAIANLIGFDASVLGNHEFDLGTFEVADIIGTEVAGGFSENGILAELENPGTLFPYLAANLDFSGDPNLPFLFAEELLTTDAFDLTQAIADLEAAVAAAGGDEAALRPAEEEGNDDFIDFDRIAPSVIAEVDGEQVGIIGLTTPDLASLSSPGGVEVIGPEGVPSDPAVLQGLADIANEQVDLLQAQGIDKIVLVSHLQQFSFEQALAPLVEGVDVFLAGGSDFILLDENDEPFGADVAGDTYPVLTTNADGDPAVLLSTNGEFTYVGRLLVEFDENGVLIPDSIDSIESGAFRTTDQGVLDAVELLGITPEAADITNFAELDLAAIEADAANAIGSIEFDMAGEAGLVQNLTGTVEAVVESQDGNVAGFTDVFLDGIRANVRTQETNLGNLSADANLFYAQQLDPEVTVSLQNAGGIRVQIGDLVVDQDTDENAFLPPQENDFRPEGAVSQLAISDVFRFDNSLTLQTITQADLIVQLENGVENAIATLDNEPGQFPQVAGVAFSFDPNLPANDRILSAALTDADGNPTTVLVENGEFVGDADAPVRVVINEFLAGLLGDGIDEPDGYTFEQLAVDNPEFADVINLEEVPAPATFDEIQFSGATVNGQVDAVAEFLNEFHATPETAFNEAETPVAEDLRIQNVAFREDTVLAPLAIADQPFEFVSIGSIGADDPITGSFDATFPPALFSIEGEEVALFDGTDDFVFTGGGDDSVSTLSPTSEGGNLVLGGSGNDEFFANTGDVFQGGLGDDELFANESSGGNILFGGAGIDTLFAGGNDRLFGGADGDTLIVLENGGNELTGGSGVDTFQIAAADVPSSASTITDYTDEDIIGIALGGVDGIEDLDLAEAPEGTTISVIAADGSLLPLALVAGVVAADLTADDFVFTGDPAAALPTAPAAAPTDLTELSADVIVATGTGEIIAGTEVEDVLFVSDGSGNTLNGGLGNDILNSSEGGGNILNGEDGEDIILAGSGDTANGGAGDDSLFDAEGVGNVTFDLTGGGSDSVFLVTSEALPAAPNTITGFGAGDLLVLAGAGETADAFEDLTIADDGTDTLVADSAGAAIATVTGVLAADLTAEDFLFVEELSVVSLENPVALEVDLDVDGDGEVTPAIDILNIFRALAGAPQAIVVLEGLEITQQEIVDNVNAIAAIDPLALDVDGSGAVDLAIDVLNIFRALAGAPQAIVIPEGLDATQQDVVDMTNALVA